MKTRLWKTTVAKWEKGRYRRSGDRRKHGWSGGSLATSLCTFGEPVETVSSSISNAHSRLSTNDDHLTTTRICDIDENVFPIGSIRL